MYKIAHQGVATKMKLIEPSKLQTMEKDDIVIVNRIRLNSKLVECEIKSVHPSETAAIRQAIRTMKSRERKCKRTIMGAEMCVGDIMKIFPEYESLPKNSFALVND